MNVIGIVQARCGSTRFPNKVLQSIGGVPLIEYLYRRLIRASKLDTVVIATSNSIKDDELVSFLASKNIPYFRGDELDVLSRYYEASVKFHADHIVRVTGDCPLIDPDVVDAVITDYFDHQVDYCSNTLSPTYPDGLDVSIFSSASLKYTHENATSSYDREYVVTYLRSCSHHSVYSHVSSTDYSFLRLTVDEPVDLDVIANVVQSFNPDQFISYQDILNLYHSSPDLFAANRSISRDEGSKYGAGFKLWKRAQQLIPGGNSLFSKRPELYLPHLWPTYFTKAKDCYVWDLEGNKYIDMLFAVGASILGYACNDVDSAVKDCIDNGNMCSLNCPEEVELADRLISLHPWADQARFARSGGEANVLAIRIARAFSGRTNVAFCGYHGWHDWYLSSYNHTSGLLSKHLTTGLTANGVPSALDGTSFPFNFNDLDTLEQLMIEKSIGVVKIEVFRNLEPSQEYLASIKDLCNKYNCVLIFDECTSGFRQAFGGIHKLYNIYPDMCILGKALGNGYPITSVIGTSRVMSAAKMSFISSTFWTERSGYVAALATLDKMAQIKSWEIITRVGTEIMLRWQQIADKYFLPINIFGYPAIPKFTLPVDNWPAYKTIFSKIMLDRGFLASNLIYVSVIHDDEALLSSYFSSVDDAFSVIARCHNGDDISNYLDTPFASADFKRLN